MELIIRHFSELTAFELHEILRIRSQVFVVEQNCVYQDVDGKDLNAYHLYIKDDTGIQACLRVLDKGVSFEEAAIGRVVCIKRRQGLATRLLQEAIKVAQTHFNAHKISLEAQVYARTLYEKQGFRQVSEEFLEDGIPHIKMTWEETPGGSAPGAPAQGTNVP